MIELKQERLLCLLAFAATSACTYMYVTFGSCDKIGLPGAGLFVKSPVGVAKKYPIHNDPSEIMVGMAWIMSFLSNQLSCLYLLVIQRQCELFPPVFYLCWVAGGVLSLTWTYTYSQEMHLASAIIVGSVYVLAPFQLAVGVKYFTENH
uniref:Uncharacterized protein n=1 Tax=Ciona savignyi TaxID=51511 RepID=H2YC48_CIOSA